MPYPYGTQNAPAVGNGLGGLPRRTTSSGGGSQGLQYAESTVAVYGRCSSNNYIFKGQSGKAYAWPSLLGTSGLIELGAYAYRSDTSLNAAPNSNNSIYVQPTAGHANGFAIYAAYWQSYGNLPGSSYYFNANGDIVDSVSISNGGNAGNAYSAFSPDGTKAVIGFQYGPSSDNPNVAVEKCYYRYGVGTKTVVATGYNLTIINIAVNNVGKVAVLFMDSNAQLVLRIYNESTNTQERSATFGYPDQNRCMVRTAPDGKFLISVDSTLYVYDPTNGTSTNTAMGAACYGLYVTNSGHIIWATVNTTSDPRNYNLKKYNYPAITVAATYNSFLSSVYTYGANLFFSEEPGTNRLAVSNRYWGAGIWESDWTTLVTGYASGGWAPEGQIVFAPFGGYSYFIGMSNTSYRYEYAATYSDKVYLAGIALESIPTPSASGVTIRMQTAGVKTISADFRSVGGIALITSGLTP